MDGIDPRLRGPEQSSSSQSQIYSNVPPPQYPQPPVKLPPPSPQQQHHQQPAQQQLQHAAGLPTWPQDGGDGYYQQSPNAPPSNMFSHGGATMAFASNNGQGAGASKRPRACEACRGLKVRCEFDGASRDCKRCIKAGRQCQVTQPSRKRQKKTDTKVAELEKKIEDLHAKMVARGALPLGQSGAEDSYDEEDASRLSILDSSTTTARVAQMVPAEGEGRHHILPRGSYGGPLQQQSPYASSSALPSRKRRMPSYAEEEASYPKQQQSSSPVSFHKHPNLSQYTNQATTPAPDTSHLQPLIMAEAAMSKAAEHNASLQSSTTKVVYGDIVERHIPDEATALNSFRHYSEFMAPRMPVVIFPSNINPAMIRQSMPVLFLAIMAVAGPRVAQPRLTDAFVETIVSDRIMKGGEKSLELLQALEVLAIWYWPSNGNDDAFSLYIAIASQMALDLKIDQTGPGEPWSAWVAENPQLSTAEIHEGARALLGTFLLSTNAAIGARKQSLTWGDFPVLHATKFLQSSPEATPSDRLLCELVQLELICDKVRLASGGMFLERLPQFEQALSEWTKSHSDRNRPVTLELNYHVMNLFMHERAVASGISITESSVISICLSSIHGILESFLKLTADEIPSVPVFQLIRVTYALFALAKLHKFVSQEELKVGLYLEGVLALLRNSEKTVPSRAAHWFLVLLAALEKWTQTQKAQTPLDVLSDAAIPYAAIPAGAKAASRLVQADAVIQDTEILGRRAFKKLLSEMAEKMGGA